MDSGGGSSSSSSNGWRRFYQPQNLASTLGMATAAGVGGGIVVPWRTSDRFDNLQRMSSPSPPPQFIEMPVSSRLQSISRKRVLDGPNQSTTTTSTTVIDIDDDDDDSSSSSSQEVMFLTKQHKRPRVEQLNEAASTVLRPIPGVHAYNKTFRLFTPAEIGMLAKYMVLNGIGVPNLDGGAHSLTRIGPDMQHQLIDEDFINLMAWCCSALSIIRKQQVGDLGFPQMPNLDATQQTQLERKYVPNIATVYMQTSFEYLQQLHLKLGQLRSHKKTEVDKSFPAILNMSSDAQFWARIITSDHVPSQGHLGGVDLFSAGTDINRLLRGIRTHLHMGETGYYIILGGLPVTITQLPPQSPEDAINASDSSISNLNPHIVPGGGVQEFGSSPADVDANLRRLLRAREVIMLPLHLSNHYMLAFYNMQTHSVYFYDSMKNNGHYSEVWQGALMAFFGGTFGAELRAQHAAMRYPQTLGTFTGMNVSVEYPLNAFQECLSYDARNQSAHQVGNATECGAFVCFYMWLAMRGVDFMPPYNDNLTTRQPLWIGNYPGLDVNFVRSQVRPALRQFYEELQDAYELEMHQIVL